jgi:hypothetical protein
MSPAGAQNLAELTEVVQPEVVELRGLEFRRAVETTFQSAAALQQVLQQELDRTYPGDTLAALEKRLLKFGFVVSPINLRQMVTRLFSQQIAGYYDPRRKKMVLIEHDDADSGQYTVFPMDVLGEMFVAQLGVSLDKVLLAHELTHVLQDQHFDLLSLPIEDLDPEDRTSAVRALIEGDATLVMLDYVLARQGTDSTQVPDIADNLQAWSQNPLVSGLGLFQSVPRYIIENLLFSYTYGYEFVLHLKKRGGWERINQAYRDLPVSTEQILHPAKYSEERDAPTSIQLPPLSAALAGWRELERNTLGEFNITILLDGFLPTPQAQAASAGWDGDRFALYEQLTTGDLLLVWHSTWDSETDAEEFFGHTAQMLEKRYTLKATDSSRESSEVHKVWQMDETTIVLERQGADVLLLDGAPAALVPRLCSTIWEQVVLR